jgi:hypothetical protein
MSTSARLVFGIICGSPGMMDVSHIVPVIHPNNPSAPIAEPARHSL